MADGERSWLRQGEAFWRAHHEAWKRSDLNQREYCAVQDIPLKAFGNWRAQFKAGPQPLAAKLLYRRRGLSHTSSHTLGHSLNHTTKAEPPGPIVPRAREGRRRNFTDADKRWIVEEAARPGVSLSAVARRYGIAARVLFRWKQELATGPAFVTVEIAEGAAPAWEQTP
jgi:hypothetical protein